MTPRRPKVDPPPGTRRPGGPVQGGVTRSSRDATDDRAPLPHERDESSDAANRGQGQPDPVIRQAHEDVEKGLMDTDRGPPMESLYTHRFRRRR